MFKTAFRPVSGWLKKRNPMWIVLPYCTLSAFATFPSAEAQTAMLVAGALFLFVLAAWRCGCD